jgi:hypothetical protein
VPTGSAFSPRRWPFRLIWFGGLPKSEILLVFLFTFFIFLFFLGFSLFNSFQLAIFKLFSVGFNIKINRSIRGICIAIGNYFFDEGDDFRDVLSDSGDVIWNFNSQ